jgi:hypothetical protein
VGALYLLTTLSPLVLPAFRRWDAPAVGAVEGAALGRAA